MTLSRAGPPKKYRPRSGKPGGGGNTEHLNDTSRSPDGNPTVEDLGVVFATEALEAEQVYLTAAWLNPFEGNNAACDADMRSATFSTAEHSVIFWYVCKCAEHGRTPTVDRAVQLAARCNDARLSTDDLLSILIPPLSVIEAKRIGDYAATVADFGRRRDLSREHARRSVELFVGADYEVLIRARERNMPKLLGRVVA